MKKQSKSVLKRLKAQQKGGKTRASDGTLTRTSTRSENDIQQAVKKMREIAKKNQTGG